MLQEACKQFHLANAMDAAGPKGFIPEKVDVVEIEDSPRKFTDRVCLPEGGDGLLQTPEPKEVDSKESPQSTEKAFDASAARRSLRFPKLWWDAHGNVRIGKKLSFAPKFVKMTPSERGGESLEWPPMPFYIGGRYFSRDIRVDSEDEAMDDGCDEPMGYGSDEEMGDGSEKAKGDGYAGNTAGMDVDAEGAHSESGAAPAEPEEQTQPVLADGYETLEVQEEVEV